MKRIVVLSGAGVSADSGLSTFRDSDGLWENYSVEEICTHEAIERDREKVIHFYDHIRYGIMNAKPNAGHLSLVDLEKCYDVQIITQNVDDLHERAGSKSVIHLHGEIMKLRSSINELATVDIKDVTDGYEQPLDLKHSDGSLLRPFIVFFGEGVPMFEDAVDMMQTADIVIIVGTSLAVYPAASLVRYVPSGVKIYIVDPGNPDMSHIINPLEHIKKKGAEGLPELVRRLLSEV